MYFHNNNDDSNTEICLLLAGTILRGLNELILT